MLRRLFLVLVLAALLPDPAWAGFTKAVMAHAQGRYDQALMMLRPLAETAHHPYAQYYLGMYLNGQGMAPDRKEAGHWLTSAAEQGVAQAQYRLGQLYAKGQGVPKDMEIAYAWFGVAAHLGNTQPATEKKSAATALSGDALRKGRIPRNRLHCSVRQTARRAQVVDTVDVGWARRAVYAVAHHHYPQSGSP